MHHGDKDSANMSLAQARTTLFPLSGMAWSSVEPPPGGVWASLDLGWTMDGYLQTS